MRQKLFILSLLIPINTYASLQDTEIHIRNPGTPIHTNPQERYPLRPNGSQSLQNSKYKDSLITLAIEAYHAQNYKHAINYLDELKTISSLERTYHTASARLLARCYSLTENYEAAAVIWNEYLFECEKNQSTPSTYDLLEIARLHFFAKKYEASKNVYDRALNAPNQESTDFLPQDFKLYAIACYQCGDNQLALQKYLLAPVGEDVTTQVFDHLHLSLIYYANNRFDHYQAHLERFFEKFPRENPNEMAITCLDSLISELSTKEDYCNFARAMFLKEHLK